MCIAPLLANKQIQSENTEMQQALTAIYQQHDFEDLLEYLDKLNRIYGEQSESSTLKEMITTRQQEMQKKLEMRDKTQANDPNQS